MFTFKDCKSGNRCFLEGTVESDQTVVNNTLMSALNEIKYIFRLRPHVLLQHFWQKAEHITLNSNFLFL
jgi:hypothetical protein